MSIPYRRRLLAGSMLACALAAAAGARPALAATRQFDIPAEAAAKAIADFATQSGLQIIAPTGQLHGVLTPALSGAFEPREALRRLLANTGLEVSSDNGAVIVLKTATRVMPADYAAAAAEQPAAESAPPSADAAKPEPSPAPAALSEIVVTGSRVISNSANSPTPLTTVGTEQLLTLAPTSITDALNDLPVFSGSRNQFSNPGSGATTAQGGNGPADVLNLRNLGALRTLVLYDGNRIPPSLYNGTTDVDIIPQELIQRVDIVTGGASAVYGSDAVAGVVNFVTNNNFNGFKAHAQYGVSQYGDSQNYDIGGAYGTPFAGGKGHVEFSYDYRDNDGILYRSSRSWDDLPAIGGAGTAASPYQLYTDVHLAGYTYGGLITSGSLKNNMFASNGVLSPFVSGAPTGNSSYQVGGSGADQDSSMESPFNQNQIFGRADYDFTDYLHGFVVASANLRTDENFSGYQALTNVTLQGNNAFLPPGVSPGSTFTLSELMQDAPRAGALSHSQQYFLNAGLEGKLGGYNWNITYTHGAADLQTSALNDLNQQNLAAAEDAVVNPSTGQIVCKASLYNSAYSNCVPLNLFGPTAASQAALNYVLGTVTFNSTTTMDAVDGSFRGSPFSTWAGPVSAAVSGDWRRVSYVISSNGPSTELENCSSLGYVSANCSATATVWQTTFPSGPLVSQSVGEGALEVDAPLAKDLPFIKSFDLNGAVRYTDYSTSGDFTTWKVGLVWALTDELKFRATTSRDIRAPSLYDLYAPATYQYGVRTDYLTGAIQNLPNINIGNSNLKAEQGYTTTMGIVWQPSFLPGATLSIDTYHIDILDALTTIQGFNAPIQQDCYASGGTSPYCALIQRPGGPLNSSANATAYYAEAFNIGKEWTYGADVEADYTHSLLGRRADLRVLMNYQPHNYYEAAGSGLTDQGDAGWGATGIEPEPSFQLTALAGYQVTGMFRIDLSERYQNAFHNSGVLGQIWSNPIVPAYATTGVTFTYDLKDRLYVPDSSVFFNIDNLFNASPPLEGYYGAAVTSSAGSEYEFSNDPVGRAFMIGIRIRG